jgi:hypothetical protein
MPGCGNSEPPRCFPPAGRRDSSLVRDPKGRHRGKNPARWDSRKPSFRKRNEFRTLRSSVPYQGLCFFHASVKVHEYRRDLYRRYTRLFFILPLPEQFQPFLFSDPRVLQQSMRIPPNCPHPLQLHACCIGLHPRPRVSSPSIPIFGSPLPSRVQGLLVSKSPRLDSQIDLVPPAPWMAREDTIRIFRQAL